MIFEKTPIEGAYIVHLKKLEDERGFFARAFCTDEFGQHEIPNEIVQVNNSYNIKAGTVRGFHFQRQPDEEMKAVRCVRGSIYDVIVDIRPESRTYLQNFSIELTSENRTMLVVPKGCAHAFQTLRDDTEVIYFSSTRYAPKSEGGIRWNDPVVTVKWPLPVSEVSDKDKNHPDFKA